MPEVLDGDGSAQQSEEDYVPTADAIGHGEAAVVPLAELLQAHLNHNK